MKLIEFSFFCVKLFNRSMVLASTSIAHYQQHSQDLGQGHIFIRCPEVICRRNRCHIHSIHRRHQTATTKMNERSDSIRNCSENWIKNNAK